jgi:hypothetical protein
VLHKDAPCGKIIETPYSSKPFKVLPWLPFPILGIVVMAACPVFPDSFDYDFLKILAENLAVISDECFQRAGFCAIQVCPVCCSLFGWWQWHVFDFVLGFLAC